MITNFKGPYRFLSNFYPCTILYNNEVWSSSEAFYQAEKAPSLAEVERVRLMKTPGEAKRAGARFALPENWEERKVPIMKFILGLKFKDPVLRNKLLQTGSTKLIEENSWHDNFWGNCYCTKCKEIYGKNMLGELLMELRTNYQKEDTEKVQPTLFGQVITEEEFRARLRGVLGIDKYGVGKGVIKSVTGPGRSGAIAAVYASHFLGISFIPYGQRCPDNLRPIIVIDTAAQTGRTLRKAQSKYETKFAIALFNEPPRCKFWYEKQ